MAGAVLGVVVGEARAPYAGERAHAHAAALRGRDEAEDLVRLERLTRARHVGQDRLRVGLDSLQP